MKSQKSKILVSACLYGFCCRYDGKSNILKDDTFLKLKNSGRLIPVCAEEMGGLPTPRIPSEIRNGKVISEKGKDVTEEFEKGAQRALEIAKENNVKVAVLKDSSPSCGSKSIYDGTFTGTKISGVGVLARKLIESGIPVFNENEIEIALLLANGNESEGIK